MAEAFSLVTMLEDEDELILRIHLQEITRLHRTEEELDELMRRLAEHIGPKMVRRSPIPAADPVTTWPATSDKSL